jgi:hypothetical protein
MSEQNNFALEDCRYIIQDAPVTASYVNGSLVVSGSGEYKSLMYTVSETIRKRYGIDITLNFS